MRAPRTVAVTIAVLALVAGGASLAWACTPRASIVLSPTEGQAGTTVSVRGTNFQEGPVRVYWENRNGASRWMATATGPDFTLRVTIPDSAPDGTGYISGVSSPYKAEAPFTVTAAPAPTDTDGEEQAGDGTRSGSTSGSVDAGGEGESGGDSGTTSRTVTVEDSDGTSAPSSSSGDTSSDRQPSGDQTSSSSTSSSDSQADTSSTDTRSDRSQSPEQEPATAGAAPEGATDQGQAAPASQSGQPPASSGPRSEAGPARESAEPGLHAGTADHGSRPGGHGPASGASLPGEPRPAAEGGAVSQPDLGRAHPAPEAATAADLWSGFTGADTPSLAPALEPGVGAAPHPGGSLTAGMALLAAGLVLLLAGAGVGMARRRRQVPLRG